MSLDNIAFVDIETTGSRAESDRILEIAIICINNGKLETEFSTLVNPQMPYSPFIEMMTGIKPSDVENAPTFEEIQHTIYDLLKDRLFVAHNVGFDYGFIKYEFKRLGLSFHADRCCTVKLSRHFYPEYRTHNLDSLIERFHFSCQSRHRAYSDTSVLWQFYQHLCNTFPHDRIKEAVTTIAKRPALPPHINKANVENLPEQPGVYVFYGDEGLPLYVGKSKNIKDRVFSHFAMVNESAKERDIAAQIRDLEVHRTAGELGALLLETKLVKQLHPIYNRRLRKYEELFCIVKETNTHGYDIPVIQRMKIDELHDVSAVLAMHKTKAQAKKHLEYVLEEHELCRVLLGLERSTSGCFNSKLDICHGACLGKENPLLYNARFHAAFAQSAVPDWPYKGAVLIDEIDLENRAGEKYIFYDWKYKGVIKYTQEESQFKEVAQESFDYDVFIILKNYLRSHHAKHIKQLSLQELQTLRNSYSF